MNGNRSGDNPPRALTFRDASTILSAAVVQYRLSPREAETLSLLLGGASLAEAARDMHITLSTAQDHVAKLMLKTDATSRHGMLTKILGWPTLSTTDHILLKLRLEATYETIKTLVKTEDRPRRRPRVG